jgi:peroxiredoxin
MLKVGEVAPAFSERTSDGRVVTLPALLGKPVILYFFPKAFTHGCTVETKGFRDNYEDLRELGFEVIGISTDSPEEQCRFAQQLGVAYPMIGDRQGHVARAYGVLWPIIPLARRITYVLDERHVVAGVFHHEFQVSRHLDEVLRFCKQWPSRPPHSPVRPRGDR